MKRFAAVLFVFVSVLTMAFTPLPQETQPFDRVLNIALMLVVGFASLIGVSKLVAALVNLLKAFGIVRNGTSANWAAGLNLLAFVALIGFGVFRPDLALIVLDGYAGQLAMVAVFVLGLYLQMTGSKPAHDALSDAGIPLVGKSFDLPNKIGG